jgi:hypothetical protein
MSALEYWSAGVGKITQTITPLTQYSITQTAESPLARDSIAEQIDLDELVSPNLPHRRHPIADSHHVPTTDCLAGFRLLCARRFCGGGEPRDICFAPFPLCGVARVRARVRCEGVRDQYTRHHVAPDWRSGTTGTHAGGTGSGINHRGRGTLGECGHRARFVCGRRVASVAQSVDC